MASGHGSLPLTLETRLDNQLDVPHHVSPAALTPPDTPTSESEWNGQDSKRKVQAVTPCRNRKTSGTDLQHSEPVKFPYDLEYLVNDGDDRRREYGRGAWSVVYTARSTWTTSPTARSTPPSSPATSSRVLAVKAPLRRDAQAVLAAEALILGRITATRNHNRHVVPFYGYEPETHSIVMSAIPLSLSTYIENRSAIARQTFSTRTMFDPVLTMAHWRELAVQLVDGLAWLHHEAGVVHGDVKPHNILLRERNDDEDDTGRGSNRFPYEALYADFSSAHAMSAPRSELHATTPLSALTPPFAAPELLTIAALKSPDTLATPASDVFSLALTLLAAATGELLLYPGTSSMQRLAMSREGHRVLDFIRSGPHSSRVPCKGLVEQFVRPAVAKDPSERVDASEWLRIIDSFST